MKFILAIVFTFLFGIWNGYIFSHLWTWFVMPIFTVPALSALSAFGLLLSIRFITFRKPSDADLKNAEERDMAEFIATQLTWSFLLPALTWGVAAILKFWIM